MTRLLRLLGAPLLALGLLGISSPHPTVAATITVTNCNSSGSGSLAAAVASATPGDTINFGLDCTGTSKIVLRATITIDKNLTVGLKRTRGRGNGEALGHDAIS